MAKKKDPPTSNEKSGEKKTTSKLEAVDSSTKKVQEKNSSTTKSNKPTATFWDRLDDFLFQPIDISPLVYFRICFGCILLWEVYRMFRSNHVDKYYIKPDFHFQYPYMEWMPGPLPGNYMYIFFVVMAILYTFVVLGLWYRISITLTFLGFAYWLFLDMATWLNHFYLVMLINFAMIFIPAHCNASLDVLRNPSLRAAKVPAWSKHLLTYLVSIPYFFGALAKINKDWLAGEPMKMWLLNKTSFPVVGHLFKEWWACYFFSWGGLVFDFIIVPLLLYKPTRTFAVINCLFFHLMNDQMFKIGIFPWFMMFATPIYFEPAYVQFALKFECVFCEPVKTLQERQCPKSKRPIVRSLLGLFCGTLFIMPFRHYLYPGPTSWSEEGYLYSWQMMLRDKGEHYADFTVYVTDKNGDTSEIDIDNKKYLSNKIQRTRMPQRPDMILKFAHYLCDIKSRPKNVEEVQVYVDSMVGMNGRVPQHLIDPEADLCQERLSFWAAPWIVPLTTPLELKSEKNILRFIRHGNPQEYVGRAVAKRVSKGDDDDEDSYEIIVGTITRYDSEKKKWKVRYEGSEDEVNLDRTNLANRLFIHQMEEWRKETDGGEFVYEKKKSVEDDSARNSEL